MKQPLPDETLRKRVSDRALWCFLYELLLDSWQTSPGDFLKAVASFALVMALLTTVAIMVPGVMLVMLAFVLGWALFYAFGTIAECWRDRDYPLARSGILFTLGIAAALALSLTGLWWYVGQPSVESGAGEIARCAMAVSWQRC